MPANVRGGECAGLVRSCRRYVYNLQHLFAVPRSMTRHGGTAYLLSVPELRPCGRVRSASWLAALVLCGLLLAACGISPASNVTSAAASQSASVPASHRVSRSTAASRRNVFAQPVLNPRVAVTPSGVYVAWQLSPPG